MSAERQRRITTVLGWAMLLVQAKVLHVFWSGMRDDLPEAAAANPGILRERIAWLRPPAWQVAWLDRYLMVALLTAFFLLVGMWGAGVLRWRRERGE